MTSWPLVTLADCCHIVSGATPKTSVEEYWDGDIDWITPKDLSGLDGAYIHRTPRRITQAGLASCGANILPPQSVLFSSRAPIGHVAINTVPMATNQGFKSLIPHTNRVDAKYLFYWLRANRSYLEGLGNGATFKEVSKAIVSRVEIPVPPLEEQRRIAAILDQADALRAKRREALALLDDLTQSIFLDMFGTVDVGDSRTVSLGEVAQIASGITKGRKLGDVATTSVPYLAVSNVQDGSLNMRVVKEIDATTAEIERYRLQEADLVLTEGGDPDKLGRGTVWNNELLLCIHQNHIFRVRIVDSEQLHPAYLNQYMSGRAARAYFLRSAKQTTGIASINMTQLRGLPVVVPPLQRQLEFAAAAEAACRQVRLAKDHALATDSLSISLQSRAFAGEL